jgi:hypothetical protein
MVHLFIAFQPKLNLTRKILEARGGIEPPIMVLQTIALPLGDRATVPEPLPVRSLPCSGKEKPIKNPTN